MPQVPVGSKETWSLGLLSCSCRLPGDPGTGRPCAPPSDYRARAAEPHCSPPIVHQVPRVPGRAKEKGEQAGTRLPHAV